MQKKFLVFPAFHLWTVYLKRALYQLIRLFECVLYVYVSYHVFQDVALTLLESGANVDQKNTTKQTPLFSACEGLHRNLAHVRFKHLGDFRYILWSTGHPMYFNHV